MTGQPAAELLATAWQRVRQASKIADDSSSQEVLAVYREVVDIYFGSLDVWAAENDPAIWRGVSLPESLDDLPSGGYGPIKKPSRGKVV